VLDAEEHATVGRVLRDISDHEYLPADTLTLEGLIDPPPPGRLYLAANFPTARPEARWRENREYKAAVRARREERRLREERGEAGPNDP
jgi:hypothetical protein